LFSLPLPVFLRCFPIVFFSFYSILRSELFSRSELASTSLSNIALFPAEMAIFLVVFFFRLDAFLLSSSEDCATAPPDVRGLSAFFRRLFLIPVRQRIGGLILCPFKGLFFPSGPSEAVSYQKFPHFLLRGSRTQPPLSSYPVFLSLPNPPFPSLCAKIFFLECGEVFPAIHTLLVS